MGRVLTCVVGILFLLSIIMFLGQVEYIDSMELMLGLNTTFLSVFLELLFNEQFTLLVNPLYAVMWAYLLYYFLGLSSLPLLLSFKLNEIVFGYSWWFNCFWNMWYYSYIFYQWVLSAFA